MSYKVVNLTDDTIVIRAEPEPEFVPDIPPKKNLLSII